jgi:hypothetical protein
VRAETVDDLEAIRTKVLCCFEAGALATGATLEIGGQRHPYTQLRHDPDLAAAYRRNAEALGRIFPDPTAASRPGGSTDAVRAFQARYGLAVSGLLDCEARREQLPALDQWEFDPRPSAWSQPRARDGRRHSSAWLAA